MGRATFDRLGVVVLPTGAGKTRVAIAAILEAGVPSAVLCPTRALAAAWKAELERWVGPPIGLVGDGHHLVERGTVLTFESAYRHMDLLGDRFGPLVGDEVHHFGGGVRAEALESSAAVARLGLTATAPPRTSEASAAIEELVGPVVFEMGFADLVGTHLADVTLTRIAVRLEPDEREAYERGVRRYEELARAFRRAYPGGDYVSLVRAIAGTSDGRRALRDNAQALELAAFPRSKRRLVGELLLRHQGDKSIVFTAYAENAYRLALDNLVPVITGQTGVRERQYIFDQFGKGTLRTIASARVLNEVWLRVLVDEAEAFAGRPADAADERVREAVIPIARLHGAGARAVLGVWCIERRRWKKRVASKVSPERIRRTVFELAVDRARPAALEEASRELGLTPTEIEDSLFADREGARHLVLPARPRTPSELVERYNLALAQPLLMRSFEVVAEVRASARKVVGYAKLHGLMATFESVADGTKVTLSGPLALFHETTKYGRALAGFLPALAVTPGWSLAAQILLGGRRHELALDAAAPLPRTHALPSSFDSAVERRLAVDIRRLASGWELAREDTIIRVGSRLFYPDFTLVSARGRALVEVVGYWTPEHLASKAEALRAVKVPMVVCVDERHARG